MKSKKQLKKEYDIVYRKKNKEKIRKRNKLYNQRPEVKKRNKKNYKKNKKKIIIRDKIRYEKIKNTPEYKQSRKKYLKKYLSILENRAKQKKQSKEYSQRPEVKKHIHRYLTKYNNIPENRIRKRKKARKNNKKRWNIDQDYTIRRKLRSLLRGALRRYTKTGNLMSASKYGVDYKSIIEYLKPFPKDLSKYHIDHIKPLVSFDLTNPEEIKKAFAPKNHQWLTIQENLSKGAKIL